LQVGNTISEAVALFFPDWSARTRARYARAQRTAEHLGKKAELAHRRGRLVRLEGTFRVAGLEARLESMLIMVALARDGAS
jgi:hypothetical protein